MRITNQLIHANQQFNYRVNQKAIYDLNTRLSSGRLIQNSYDDSGIYMDGTRLDYEISLLDQVKESTQKATEFSKNSDKALSDFSLYLTNFKTKLIQAANQIHDETSRNAIANDLEGIKNHLVNIANSSINGQFLFSGTALTTKPIDESGNYKGNSQTINSVIGAHQTVTYNINGKDLFLGQDNDYKKEITTNISIMNNKKKLLDPNSDEFIEPSDKIYDIIGNGYQSELYSRSKGDMKENDFKANELAKTTFFIQGVTPYAKSFATKIAMSPDSSVQSLLDNIGYALGNDRNGESKAVDVTINGSGQIQITDLKRGNQMLDFHIFALTNTKGEESYKLSNSSPKIILNPQKLNNTRITKDDTGLYITKGNSQFILWANEDDTFSFAQISNNQKRNIQTINLVDNDGEVVLDLEKLLSTNPSDGFTKFNDSDMDNLITNKLRNSRGELINSSANSLEDIKDINANIKNGRLTLTSFIKSNFQDSVGNESLATNYNDVRFTKNSNILLGNVSQVVKKTNEFANDKTKLSEVATGSLIDDKNLTMRVKSKDGNNYNVTINFKSNGKANLRIIKADERFINQNIIYNGSIYTGKYDESKKITDMFETKSEDITFKQLNDVISSVASGIMPDQNSINILTTNTYALEGNFDNVNNLKQALKTDITDESARKLIDEAIDAQRLDFSHPINSDSLKEGSFLKNLSGFLYNDSIKKASEVVEVGLDYQGRLMITDKQSSVTNIEFAIFEDDGSQFGQNSKGSLFRFNSNNLISIDKPTLDIFKDLDEMIFAVRDGSYRANYQSANSRTTGIQGALKRIDHIMDHINKQHTLAGSYTRSLEDSNQRAQTLSVNVMSVKSDLMDADYGESLLLFNQRYLSFQAMLSTSAKISQLSLLNYM